MSRTPRVPLGLGAAVSAEGNIFARRCFLDAIARCAPDVIRELIDIATRPALERSAAGCFDTTTELALRSWASRWGIPYADRFWMPEVRSHVEHWHLFPATAGRWGGFIGSYRAIEWPALQPWAATEESERDFDARVDAYKAMVKALPGIQATPETFTASDFDAFVLEHVKQVPIDKVLDTRQP